MEQEKKYLKTIEEVSDALVSGKVIHNKYGTKIWKDKNGFLVSERKDESKFLNDYMFQPDDEPYIPESKPVEVKLWHLYEDRDGKKVFIIGKLQSDAVFPFRGVPIDSYDVCGYTEMGNPYENYCSDLVKELADLSQYFGK